LFEIFTGRRAIDSSTIGDLKDFQFAVAWFVRVIE